VCCSALCPFDCLCFNRFDALLIADPFLQRKPLFEESPDDDQYLRSWHKMAGSLGFVTRHLSGKHTIEEISEKGGR
jgi:hypothetical protein